MKNSFEVNRIKIGTNGEFVYLCTHTLILIFSLCPFLPPPATSPWGQVDLDKLGQLVSTWQWEDSFYDAYVYSYPFESSTEFAFIPLRFGRGDLSNQRNGFVSTEGTIIAADVPATWRVLWQWGKWRRKQLFFFSSICSPGWIISV